MQRPASHQGLFGRGIGAAKADGKNFAGDAGAIAAVTQPLSIALERAK